MSKQRFNRRQQRKTLGNTASGASGASTVQLRPNNGQGIYTAGFQSFVPRKVDSAFYEFLREAIPIIDTAIWKLVSLDGTIEVEGNNLALVDEINDWMDNVPVNDMQQGIQAYHQNFTNEGFEQGFSMSEFIPNKKRNDIVGLRVADSKFIKFERSASGLLIRQKSETDTDYRLLNPNTLMYWSIHNENQNPYGTPLFRSCEFMAQLLATMHNSLANVWERWGDPSFSLIYKTSRKDGKNHKERCETLRDDLNSVVRAKRQGYSADFVHAIDKDSDIAINVIGANGQVLELEVPARHVLEQIVAKTGLAPWMLGQHWSTTERLAEFESEMVLADITTRQDAKLPSLTRLISTLLTMRGRTWKKGDWQLKFKQVNLHDIEKQARARFLNAQADMMGQEQAPEGEEKGYHLKKKSLGGKTPCTHGTKELYRPDTWPELDKLEDDYEARLKSDWQQLYQRVKMILGLGLPDDGSKGVTADTFTFSTDDRAAVMAALAQHLGEYKPSNIDSPVSWYYGQAYSMGLIQAADLIGKERPILDIIKNSEIFDTLAKEGFEHVKDRATLRIRDKILAEMEGYALAGSNPNEVARRLEKLFGDANSDWERLARSEMSIAAETAKGEEWEAWGVGTLDFFPAPDACPICQALKGEYPIRECPLPVIDTHPYCRCARRPGASVDTESLVRPADHAPSMATQFVPAASIKAAEAWALENALADMVSYKGASLEVANAWNEAIFDHLSKFPALRPNLQFIGTTQERQRAFVRLLVADLRGKYPQLSEEQLIKLARRKAGRTPSGVLAQSSQDPYTSGIAVNSKWAKTPDEFKSVLAHDMENGFHPEGCDSVRFVVDHELGHQLDDLLELRTSEDFKDILREVLGAGGNVGEDLSRYAATAPAETIAEAWGEYLNNENPRELAQKIGNLIESKYKAEFGGES